MEPEDSAPHHAEPPAPVSARRVSGSLAPRIAAVLVTISGVASLVTAVTPGMASRVAALERTLPFPTHASRLASALAGVGILMLARGLWWRKRTAWTLAIALLAVVALGDVFRAFDYEEALVIAAFAVWLLTQRRAFYARADPPSVAQGLRVLAAAFTVTIAYGTLGFFLLDRHFSVNFGLGAAIRQTVVMFTGFYDPHLNPITGFGRYFAASIYIVAAVAFGYALLMLLRPVLIRHPATAAEHRRAEQIVTSYGYTPLARLALLPDKAYRFGPDGTVIAYSVVGGVGLALGDPVGEKDAVPGAIADFAEMCGANGWRPAFYQTLPDHLDDYRRAGFSAVAVGLDAVIVTAAFSLEGKKYGSLRSRNRALERAGFSASVAHPPHAGRLIGELRLVSDAWLDHINGSEKSFSLGWFDEGYVRSVPVMVVHGPSGDVEAFATLSPEYRRNGIAIDLMRYGPSAPSGVMDYLFVRLFEWARDDGIEYVDLGLSALAGVGDEANDPAAEKALRFVYEYGNDFYGFKGLHEYKDKFRPDWQPRYLIYRDAPALPAVLTAVVRANAGESPGAALRRHLRRLGR